MNKQPRRRFIEKAIAVTTCSLFSSSLLGKGSTIKRSGAGHIGHLWVNRPKWLLNGMGLKSIPAIPFQPSEILPTVKGLMKRKEEFQPAMRGLSNEYTIGGVTSPGHDFLFSESLEEKLQKEKNKLDRLAGGNGGKAARILNLQDAENLVREEESTSDRAARKGDPVDKTALALDDPSQWSISWTNYKNIYRDAQPLLRNMSRTLTDVRVANAEFWPTIADYGLAYNLLILQKVTKANVPKFREQHKAAWTRSLESAYRSGSLYVIDMSIFRHMKAYQVDGFDRMTPSTTTFLVQSRRNKSLTPVSIRVSNHDGPDTFYVASDPAWLYALQAAKVSITVWGIWLGHVYHWHIVSAAMQMTMYNTLPPGHPVYELLEPQSHHLIGFDEVLLLQWKPIGPPTSLTTARRYLTLTDHFAQGRSFFDDDPKETLARFGITERDFSVNRPWDAYPMVRHLLRVWDAVEEYIDVFVEESYPDDASVAGDALLQSWIQESGSKHQGNISGLPEMDSRRALKRVLTSLVYRLTVHGATRLNLSLNPAQSFVGNYPPCLQKTDIPSPDTRISTKELLEYLPRTGTIGQMTQFYYIFLYSSPYESFIPEEGFEANLFFEGGPKAPRNAALIRLRKRIHSFIHDYDPNSPQYFQWPLNIET